MRIDGYAFLSDCQSAALVGLDGSIDWLCLPRFDSPSVFGRLLDQEAGHWLIRPSARFRTMRRYAADSLVLTTTFETAEGRVALTDAMLFAPGAREHEIGRTVPHVLERRLEGLAGSVDIEMEFAPRLEYGLTKPRHECGDGCVRAYGGEVDLTLTSDAPLACDERMASSRFTLRAGESFTFRLQYTGFGDGGDGCAPAGAGASTADTLEAWRSWAAQHRGYRGLYLDEVKIGALVLQGLTYEPSGALAAAATTSLPERLGQAWNWDYRYAWLRDASLTMFAQWVASCPHEAIRFFHFVERAGGRLEDGPVQIVYGLRGKRDLAEHALAHLAGFEDSRPVRVGNAAWTQRQLDVLGEVLDAAHLLRDQLEWDADTEELLVAYADRACREWKQPDAGMWETRDAERHYTSSKVMCWVALDRAVKLAGRLGAERHADRWARERDAVKAAVLEQAWSERAGAYAGAFGSDDLDASVLQLPIVGFLPATDPRMRATIEAVHDRLAVKGLVRRWASEPNGFLICTYWLAECLVMAGETERAVRVFERVTALANDVGLLSEEADVETGELLGNFPQAFSHVGLINAAWRISESRRGSAAAMSVAERP